MEMNLFKIVKKNFYLIIDLLGDRISGIGTDQKVFSNIFYLNIFKNMFYGTKKLN